MESGFINSQPSMAEFMTALPHINESFHGASSINGAAAVTPAPPQAQQRGAAAESPPEAPKHATATNGYSAGVSVPEYPWMKEKKTTRKQQQGRHTPFCHVFNCVPIDRYMPYIFPPVTGTSSLRMLPRHNGPFDSLIFDRSAKIICGAFSAVELLF